MPYKEPERIKIEIDLGDGFGYVAWVLAVAFVMGMAYFGSCT